MFDPMNALEYRNRVLRAQKLLAAGSVHENGGPHQYDVDSQSRNGQYHVTLTYQACDLPGCDGDDVLVDTSCTCPDFKKQRHRLQKYLAPGVDPFREPAFIVTVAGHLPVCKHTLSALMYEGWDLSR